MRLPQTIGPWKLITRLGRGGMGTVFLAELMGDMGFRQTIAVKLLDPVHLEGRPELRDALLDEARAERAKRRFGALAKIQDWP